MVLINEYLTKNEIVCQCYENAIKLQKILLDEGHVVMLSREEEFWVVNWIWTSSVGADRNGVIFINREDYEYEQYLKAEEEN